MKEKRKMQIEQGKAGSALIMTVVLTVLLSIIAVMFVAVARMDMASTSNIADNKMLDSAAKSIVEIINRQLVLDTPGVAGQEYYDYPDANNTWLANLEPYNDGGVYKWRQISDVTNYLSGNTQDVSVAVIKDYPVLTPRGLADADGDGIADSKWFELTDLRTSKGKPIYAAVRVIDNGGMINVNTAYSFDARSNDETRIDGTNQMQVNLAGLLKDDDKIDNLHKARCGGILESWSNYENNVIWRYGLPAGNYLPFDISDELELRYCYCIDSKFKSRIETNAPDTTDAYGAPGGLYNTDTGWGLTQWQRRITDPNDPNADRRHLLTTLNLDRIIAPAGQKMININTADVNDFNNLFTRIGFSADVSAQIAVNIIDYRDSNSEVTVFHNPDDGKDYYGFERPCIYISELAHRGDPNDGNSYAIELYKPYPEDEDPCGWKLIINGTQYDINNWSGSKQYYVIRWQQNSLVSLDVNSDAIIQDKGAPPFPIFTDGSTILLTRNVNGTDIVVDDSGVIPNWLVADGNNSYQRDITPAKCIRRLWDSSTNRSLMLGSGNTYIGDANFIQAHPKNDIFKNIGQIGMIFRKGAYYNIASPADKDDTIGYNSSVDKEYQVRLNLADPNFQQIFKYLTVWPPSYVSDQNETRIKGRININTAPAYVLAQLPWVSLRKNDYNDANLAKAIIAYRDKTKIPCGEPNDYGIRPDPCGFRSIGELCNVNFGSDPNFRIDYYSRDGNDQTGFPDLTTPTPTSGDGAADDFEERDLIFARISDLVTVRSDMFTAYILVRIGTDGPQKRVITILDRSGVTAANNKVAIRAFQLTPEAR